MATPTAPCDASHVVRVHHLTYYYTKPYGGGKYDTPMIRDMSFGIRPGQRVLVVGGNGAGKSTLLRLLAGKHLVAEDQVLIFGRDAFRDTTLNNTRAYVSSDWGAHTVAFQSHGQAYCADIAVGDMMQALQQAFPERRAQLLEVLRIDPRWRMHRCSDGQRRRVQLFLSLLRPSKVIILDEVLGLLDILARQDFLAYLRHESEARGVAVVLATNVFDGLTDWTTDVLYVRNGQVQVYAPIATIPKLAEFQRQHVAEPLMRTVEYWLREELQNNNGPPPQEQELGPACIDGPHENLEELRGGAGYAPGRLGHIVPSMMTQTSKEQ